MNYQVFGLAETGGFLKCLGPGRYAGSLPLSTCWNPSKRGLNTLLI
jgi:hypothetical protein